MEHLVPGGGALRDYRNRSEPVWLAMRPIISLVIACYQVERYLPDFLASLDSQTVDPTQYELIFVVDGCPERSEEVIKEWAAHTKFPVRILVKPNGGVASARNMGFAVVRGEWVTTPDPDDWLDPDYLAAIRRAQEQFPSETMFVGRTCLINEDGERVPHPLEFRFDRSESYRIDLSVDPDRIQTLGGTVFFSRAIANANELEFNERMPQASDADFVMRYLLHSGATYILVPDARYEYRRRGDGSSIVVTQASNFSRYRITFGEAHRNLLALVDSECPRWLANSILYFCYWPFARARECDEAAAAAPPEHVLAITQALRRNLRKIGTANIRNFRIVNVPTDIRIAWLAAAEAVLHTSPVELRQVSHARETVRFRFYSSAATPPRALRLERPNGESQGLDPRSVRSRRLSFLGVTWAYEHEVVLDGTLSWRGICLISDSEPTFELDGKVLPDFEIRNLLGQEKPRPPEVELALARDVTRGDSFFALRGRARNAVEGRTVNLVGDGNTVGRLKFSLAWRLYSLTGFVLRNRGCWIFDPGNTRIKERALSPVRSNGTGRGHVESRENSPIVEQIFESSLNGNGAGGPPMWLVVDSVRGLPSVGKVFKSRLVSRGSLRHFVLLKCAKLLVSSSLKEYAVAPFSPKVLSKSWVHVGAPEASPRIHCAGALNNSQIDFVISETDSEAQLYSEEGGYFRFRQNDVVQIPRFRSGRTNPLEVRKALERCASSLIGKTAER